MIIGGLSGKKKNIERIKSIDLKLTVNDLNQPVYLINFMKPYNANEENKKSKRYIEGLDKVREWHGIMSIIINNLKEKKASN